MTRMVEVTLIYFIDVDYAKTAKEAERIVHEMLENDEIKLDDPGSYMVVDKGEGSWGD